MYVTFLLKSIETGMTNFFADASKLLSQSQARLNASGALSFYGTKNDAPLFYSATQFEGSDDSDDPSDSFFPASGQVDKPSLAKKKKRAGVSSVYGGASTYSKTYNHLPQQTWGRPFPKEARKTLSQYPVNEEEPSQSYSQYHKDSDEEEGPAFLSMEDSTELGQQQPLESILFSKPLNTSISSADDTPHASFFQNSPQQDASPLRPLPKHLQPSSSSSLSASVSPHGASDMESIQLTQTLKLNAARQVSKPFAYSRPGPGKPFLGSSKGMREGGYSIPSQIDLEAQDDYAIDSESDEDSFAQSLADPASVSVPDLAKHDAVWGSVYLALVSSMFATSLIVWLRTEVPLDTGPVASPVKETMYMMLRTSGRFLMFDTLVASVASVAWIFLLKRYSLAFFYLSIVAVPLALVGLSLYPLVMSYRTTYGGNTTQDRAMRWTTLVPLGMSVFWCWFIYTGRQALHRALGIIKLASSILADNPSLVFLGYATVASFVVVTWVWMHMFARLFLAGQATTSQATSTKVWVLAGYYVFMYLWSWGVVSGFQRATVSAVVSQWYFYRNAVPCSADMTITALAYSLGPQFGTVCLSSLLRLAIRIPLYVLPRRAVGSVQLAIHSVIPASILAVTNPLALSNAVISSQGLVDSAHSLGALRHLDLGHNNPMATIDKIGRRMSVHGRRMSSVDSKLGTTAEYVGSAAEDMQEAWTAYRLAKLLLTAARGLAALGLGYGAWVHAARGADGSLYGYGAGLLAGFIGWFVLGASEGVLSMIVDASYLCFAIDNAAQGGHCTEADRQFGGR